MTSKSPLAAIVAVVVILLSYSAQSAGLSCARDYGAQLEARGQTFFNFYYFSNFGDVGRCANLQAAIATQQQLVAWLEQCDQGGVKPAQRDLVLSSSIPADQASCGS